MVVVSDVWNELWNKSRKMIINKSFRRKPPNNKNADNNQKNNELRKPLPTPTLNENNISATVTLQSHFVKYKKNNHKANNIGNTYTKIRRDTPRRKSCKTIKNFESNENSHVYCTLDTAKVEDSPKLVKCHIYEIIPHSTHSKNSLETESEASEEDIPQLLPPDADRLVRDENGLFLSPIKRVAPKSCVNRPPIPEPIERSSHCRQSLHDRFVVNTYEAGCWQRLSTRRRRNAIDDTQIIKVGERKVNSDNARVRPKSMQPTEAGETPAIGIVGELERARITPDKVLAKKLKERARQYRVVSSSILSVFDDTPVDEAEFIRTLDEEAAKMEDMSEVREPLYATPLKTSKTPEEEVKKSSASLDNEAFLKLKEEADYQCKIMRQASKALEVSRRSESSLSDIRPQVEAEKILLTANCKYEKVLQEIRQTHYEKPVESNHTATVELSGISIGVSAITEDQAGWFVLVMMDEKRIFCSTPVDVGVGYKKIDFDRTFYFDKLDSNFEITGKVYCLLHKYCKKTESRLANKLRLSSRKLRYMDLYTRDLVENSIVSSSFVPSGYFKITVNDLNPETKSVDPKVTIYENSPLSGNMDMKLRLMQMHLNYEKNGMVNLRSRSDMGAWNRRWCTLSGSVLKFWNAPMDEAFRDPLMIIDLVYCRQEIDSAKREHCPRPKSLSIVTAKGTYFMNIDTIAELREWKKPLNEVYKALCVWNMLKA